MADASAHRSRGTFYDLVDPGGDRATRSDPGRYGASISSPARGQGDRRISDAGAGSGASARRLASRCFRSQRDAGRRWCAPVLPGAEADQLRKSMATFKFTGGVSMFKDKLVDGMITERLLAGVCREDFQPARRVRLLWFSGKPRRHLCADCLCLELDEVPSSRCLLCRAAELASPWVSMRPPKSSAMPVSMASRSGRCASTDPDGIAPSNAIDGTDRHAVRLRDADGARSCGGRCCAASCRPVPTSRSIASTTYGGDPGHSGRIIGVSLQKQMRFAVFSDWRARDALWAIKALRN